MNNLTLRIILQFITDQFINATNKVRNELNNLRNGAQDSDAALGGFQQRVTRSVNSVMDFGGALRSLIAGFSLLAIAVGIKELVAFADNLRLIEGRIKNASDGVVDFSKNYAALFAISLKTGTSFAENANVFARINVGIKAMGGTSQDTLRQVDLLAKSMRISGTATSESASVIRQWSQAMASGLLRGDEFNSIMENSPRIAQAIADGLRVNIGVLRTMAETGQLTAVKVGQALASQGQAIDEEFKKIPLTIGVAVENIKTAFGQYVAEADKGKGATAGIASTMQLLADNITAVLGVMITLGKITAVVFAGSAITGITGYIAGLQAQIAAGRLAATVTAAHSQALVMNAERTVAALTARKAQITTDLQAAAQRLRLMQAEVVAAEAEVTATEGTTAHGNAVYRLNVALAERNAATVQASALELELNATNAALTASTTELAAAQAAANAGLLAQIKALGLAGAAMAGLNLAMAAMVGYMIGDWLNSFKEVRVAATYAIHAIKSLFDGLIYSVKLFGMLLDLAFTFNEVKQQKLKQAIKELKTEFIANAQAQREALDATIETEYATTKQATETDKLAESFKNIKTPQQTFIEKSAQLKKELNEGRINAQAYAEELQKLKIAMQADIAKQMSPFEKEQADLLDKQFKATHTPEENQRHDYEKQFTPAQVDELMKVWTPPKTEQKQAAAESKAIIKDTLNEQLAAIKTRADALKTDHDLELKQLDSTLKANELGLKQQVLSEQLTQIQADEKLISLKKELADKKLNIEKDLILKTAALENAAIKAKMQAVQSESVPKNVDAAAQPFMQSFAQAAQKYKVPIELLLGVAKTESGFRQNDAQGRPLKPRDKNDQIVTNATGIMQVIPKWHQVGEIDGTPLNQKRLETEPAYNIDRSAQFLASLLQQFKGDMQATLAAYHGGTKDYQAAPHQDYAKTVMGNMPAGESEDAKQAKHEKLKALNAERVANEASTQAKLKSLGIDEQNAVLEQSAAELVVKKDKEQQAKRLTEETLNAEHAAKKAAAQQELALGDISNEEYLTKLRSFAAERLAIEQKLLDDKRKLLGDDAIALAKNLHDKEALQRAYDARIKEIDNQAAIAKQEEFKNTFAPFHNALNQSVNGVLTGQQTIKNAVKNAAQSILITYANTWAQKRLLDVAQFAWEKTKFVAHWLWEESGFISKETRKMLTKAFSEIFQTKTVAVGVSSREAIEDAANAKSSIKMAWQAAKGAFSSVYESVPFPFNVVLAPIAAIAAFGGTMALGSAKRGNLRVEEDGQLFELHKNETVLPESSANAFRTVTDIVKNYVFKPETQLDPIATVDKMIAAGTLKGGWAVPESFLNLPEKSQKAANSFASDHIKASQPQGKTIFNEVTGNFEEVASDAANNQKTTDTAQQGSDLTGFKNQSGVDNHTNANQSFDFKNQSGLDSSSSETHTHIDIHIHGIALAPEAFIRKHANIFAKVAQENARNFKTGKPS